MEKYEFGVMSNKFELKADNEDYAKIAMCIFLETSAPIAVYNKGMVIDPVEVLKNGPTDIDVTKFQKIMKSIKKIV